MQCLSTFKDIMEKRLKCEKGLVEQGIIRNGKDLGETNNTSIEKPKFWSKNKNVIGDGVVGTRVVNRA